MTAPTTSGHGLTDVSGGVASDARLEVTAGPVGKGKPDEARREACLAFTAAGWHLIPDPALAAEVEAELVKHANGREDDGPCGTYGGYRYHHKHGSPPCDDCREACRIHTNARRARERQARNDLRARENAA
jgi:hypothetical protein